ncbi:type II toxin-antitoxin system VapC family toxin [Kumtagia ephedrae]|uniref:VapC toxin family PIN domain ribonuclease n=1 Tax=Kumtagia ephedrae TaxID=2116701 RepID=A0A2P7S877_9HYPH|nr:PIN domain nuclease [Mesorhizobium ephedrae]PSJ58698.1 VapC toxin family PIN domain ribonuclease [Mesorhizobium ephedrae]
MIAVDSSVWIDNLRNLDTQQVKKLAAIANPYEILVGDIVLLDVLRGLRDEQQASLVENEMRQYRIVPMLDGLLAVKAAANYRYLRAMGVTIRKSADLIIGTFCIERGHVLLHADRDFDAMQKHLGLRIY